jgi:Icc-related predicted phosphoesterase
MGNHENHEFIYRSIKDKSYLSWQEKHNIFLVQQGDTWEEDNCKFGFLGKAFNVDRKQFGSTKNRDTNYILNVEVKEAIEKFNNFGQLDFLITHSCPHSIGVGMEGKICFIETIERYIEIPFGVSTGPINDCGEQALTDLWNGLKVKPSFVLFGHMHQLKQKQIGETLFTCVGTVDSSSGKNFSIPFIVDTKTKKLEAHPDNPLFNSSYYHSTRLLEKNDYPI